MPKKHAPGHGSLQFWPRVRAKREHARVRSWASLKEAKPLGFIGFKAGMSHLIMIDNRPKATTKGEEISAPVTIIECPPMKVAAINFYKKTDSGLRLISSVMAQNLDKELGRVMSLPKSINKKVEEVKDFDDIRLLVHTQPKLTGMGNKKPKLMEIGIGGNKEEKLKLAREKLGQEIGVEDVFTEGNIVDVHAVTKGKGFQGPVKRHGIGLRSHKSEKARRGNVRGPWTGAKMWTVPHSAKMGYNLRTEHNKWVLKIGKGGEEINPKGGLMKFGLIKNPFLLVKGSVPGSRKRVLTLTHVVRPNVKVPKEAPTIKHILR